MSFFLQKVCRILYRSVVLGRVCTLAPRDAFFGPGIQMCGCCAWYVRSMWGHPEFTPRACVAFPDATVQGLRDLFCGVYGRTVVWPLSGDRFGFLLVCVEDAASTPAPFPVNRILRHSAPGLTHHDRQRRSKGCPCSRDR